MSDEKIEQEQNSAPIHELSETPFGSSVESVPEVEEKVTETPEPETEPEVEEPMTMEAAMSGSTYSGTFKKLTSGDVVEGVVVHIDREGVLVDVGTKSEGIIKPNEISKDPSLNPEDVVSVGEKIKVYVVEPDSRDGGPVLSKKRADFENAWDKVEKAFQTSEVIKAMVTDRVKGGLVVDLGIRGFVPASHVGSGKIKNLDKYVGQSMQFKVIEVDRERRKVVLSNRSAAEEERGKLREETLATLAEGQIREGVVRRLTDYGAFIDLGGVDGLLHVSEMSWTRINHPSDAVKLNQKVQVMVLKMNLKEGRVSLGLRQILPDPWEDIKKMYKHGDIIKGSVTRLVPFGAFVQVDGGVEGIIPNSELAHRRINNPEDVVSVGQEVEIKVIDLRPDERRLTLSLRQLQVDKEKEREETEYRSYSQNRAQESKTTIGDLLAGQLGDFKFESPTEEKKSAKATKAAKKEAAQEVEAAEEAEANEAVAAEAAAELAAETEAVEVVVEETAASEAEVVAEEPVAEVVAEEAVAEAEVEEVAVAEEEATPEVEVAAEEIAPEPEVAEAVVEEVAAEEVTEETATEDSEPKAE